MNAVHKLGLLVAACCAVMFGLAVPSARAQEPGLLLQIMSVNEAAYPSAQAIVAVDDTSGEAASLTGENFTVSQNGAPVAVTEVTLASSEDAPLDVAIVVDTSGSMAGAPLASAKDAAKAFISELAPNDRVSVMLFGDQVVLAQDFTSDRVAATAAIDGLVAVGNTALYQATAASAQLIASSPASRRAVVLLSDGADFGGRSVATRGEALFAAGSTGVPYFVIAQGSDLDRPYLQELSDVTRGRFLEAPNPADLEQLYVGIGRLLRSQYVVTFDASSAPVDADSTVSVTLTAGERSATDEAIFRASAAFLPQLSLSGLEEGDSLKAQRDITVEIEGGAAPRVTWYVDHVNVLEQLEPPYVFTYDPAQFIEGEHILRVTAGEGDNPIEHIVLFSSTPPAAPSGGGSPTLIYIGVGGLIGLVLAVLFFVVRGKRKPVERAIPADQRTKSWAQQVADRAAENRAQPAGADDDAPVEPEQIGEALGKLISRAGNDLGREYNVGGKPVSVGAGLRCGVHIDDPALAFEEARIWVRNGHLMLHKFTRLTALELEGVTGGWEILEAGDTFSIGQHTFEFQPLREGADIPESTPDVLRDRNASDTGPDGAPLSQPQRFSDLMPRAD